ncbi:MAG: hypothetical protein WKF87_05295 [Chryseolinea sp.]
MKTLLFVSIFFASTALKAQLVTTDDVSFKAKLLTVFRLGIASPETIMRDLKDQELTFLTADTGRIMIMKIAFSQHNFRGDQVSTTVLGKCFYYVAYNTEKYKFYRLGGFDSSDAQEFFEDLKAHEFISITSDEKVKSEIDLICLSKYVKQTKHRNQRKKQCVANCSSSLSTYLQIN